MRALFRSKFRVLTLASLALLTQCCCCILPVGWQVRQEIPAVRAVIERAESTFQVDLSAFEAQVIYSR